MKYIVYKTTNLINNKFYIGIHKTKDPNIFDGYIGCGVICTLPNTYNHAKTKFQYAVKKYGVKNFRRDVLAIFDTEEEASDLEAMIVNKEFLKREDVYNMVLGGYGGIFDGLKKPVYKYDLEGNYINSYDSYKIASDELNCDYTLISYAVRKRRVAKGFLWSDYFVNKLNVENYFINKVNKVYCYDCNGNFIKEYKSIYDASNTLNICMSSIKKSTILGILVKNEYYFSTIKDKNFSIAKSKYIKSRIVYKYDKDGFFIKKYNSQELAEKENPKSNISKSIRLGTIDDCGYFWRLIELENINIIKRNKKRIVGKFDLNGILIKKYDSATLAANENGTSVWKVLNGQNNTHKKHIYKYLS